MEDNRNEFQKRIGVGEKQVRYGVHAGKTQKLPVRREDNGKVGGEITKHWDGRQDATVFAPQVVKQSKVGE
jgi:hypothetical protein